MSDAISVLDELHSALEEATDDLEQRRDLLVVGRSSHADVVIDDRAVSRAHLELRRAPLAVRDLGSANGTVLHRDGHTVRLDTAAWYRLRSGDRLTTKHVELLRIDQTG